MMRQRISTLAAIMAFSRMTDECNEGNDFDHNGKRERARRMRQIERGILKLA